jgi:predicted SprT family Zn-dependent metalloprotease
MKVKSAEQLEEEVEALLRWSHYRGYGPHGRTISAVLKRVKLLRKRALQQTGLRLVRKAS